MGTAYITVNSDERGEPFEVFLNVGKAGSEVSAVSEAIGRLISLVLRMPRPYRHPSGCAGSWTKWRASAADGPWALAPSGSAACPTASPR